MATARAGHTDALVFVSADHAIGHRARSDNVLSENRILAPVIWLVVAVVVIALAGPVFWLLPSERERQVARLRAEARRAGLGVELATVPKLDAPAEERVSAGGVAREAKIACAVYRLPVPGARRDAPRWLLLRGGAAKAAAAEGLVPGWTLWGTVVNPPAAQTYWQIVGTVANELPGGCVAVEADGRRVAWYGGERLKGATAVEVVAGVRDGLAALARLQGESAAGGNDGRDAPRQD